MACLSLTPGAFIHKEWMAGNQQTADGSLTVQDSAAGFSVRRSDGDTIPYPRVQGRNLSAIVFGSRYVLVLDAGPTVKYVTLVISIPGQPLTREPIAAGSDYPGNPNVWVSPSSGDAFFIRGGNTQGDQVFMQIYASADATMLCPSQGFPIGAQPNSPPIYAEFDGSNLIIKNSNGIILAQAPLAGKLKVTPATGNFDDAVVGTGVPPQLATTYKTFTIKNTGVNCVRITGITDFPPFFKFSSSIPFPARLDKDASMTVDIQFQPTSVSSTAFTESLPINFDSAFPIGSGSDRFLVCKGKARAPQLSLTDSAPGGTLDFNNVPVLTSVQKTLTLKNNGEADLTLTTFPAPPNIHWNWLVPPAGTVIPYMGTLPIDITFQPQSPGTQNRTLDIVASPGPTHDFVTIKGRGCVLQAALSLPVSGPIDFSSVQKGFRTIRMFTILNTGEGSLTFSARIQPAIAGDTTATEDAELFGLWQQGVPVTEPLRGLDNLRIDPIIPCGNTPMGSGELSFGISFFATGDERIVNAQLEIFNHNDPAQEAIIQISLMASVTRPIAVDAELVIDRSQSMLEPSGNRIKIETAINAVHLFIELMRPAVGDRLGIVKFNEDPFVLQSIAEVTEESRDTMIALVNPNSLHPQLSTCITGGIMKAQDDLLLHPRLEPPKFLNKSFIVLTDGKDNRPYKNPVNGRYYTLSGGFANIPRQDQPDLTVYTYPVPVPDDHRIYSIGIGDDIDIARLSTLAQSTGGSFLHVHEFSGADFFALEKSYTQIYMEGFNYSPISDPTFNIIAGEVQTHQFEIMAGDKSALIVIYDKDSIRISFIVTTPAGETIDIHSIPVGFQLRPGMSSTGRFIEIIMPASEPERYVGTWTVKVQHDHNACRFPSNQTRLRQLNLKEIKTGFRPASCDPNYHQPILYGMAIGVQSNFRFNPVIRTYKIKTGEPIRLHGTINESGLPLKKSVINISVLKPGKEMTQFKVEGKDTFQHEFTDTVKAGFYTFIFTLRAQNLDGKNVQREYSRSVFVEGNQQLLPDTVPYGFSSRGSREVLFMWLLIGLLVLLILLIVLTVLK